MLTPPPLRSRVADPFHAWKAGCILASLVMGAAMGGCGSNEKKGSAASGSAFDGSAGGGASGTALDGGAGSSESSAGDAGSVGPISLGGPADAGTSTVSDAGTRTQACSDGGCTCIRIASIGHEGVWGACGEGGGDGTSALTTWLNTQSTAKVDTYDTMKPTLTAEFLAQYDVILLQWLRDVSDGGNDGDLWSFTPAEVSALAAWVNAGGGLITLSGYDGQSNEVTPLNTLLSFTAFTYNMDGTNGSDFAGGTCWGGASGLTGWNQATPIGANITEVGIASGRSITVAADAGADAGAITVDCPCANNQNECAVHEDIGKGHVFAFTDEWVTYTSQWLGTSTCIPSTCTDTPATAFQVPQFWYNAIRYAASAATCFTINNPAIIPPTK
jgi:hypothetical protein